MKYLLLGFFVHSQIRFKLIQECSHKIVLTGFADLKEREQERKKTKQWERERK